MGLASDGSTWIVWVGYQTVTVLLPLKQHLSILHGIPLALPPSLFTKSPKAKILGFVRNAGNPPNGRRVVSPLLQAPTPSSPGT